MKLPDNNKYYVKTESGNYIHNPWFKRLFNPMFRKVQFWTDRPFVIATKTSWLNGKPLFVKYIFSRVKYEKG